MSGRPNGALALVLVAIVVAGCSSSGVSVAGGTASTGATEGSSASPASATPTSPAAVSPAPTSAATGSALPASATPAPGEKGFILAPGTATDFCGAGRELVGVTTAKNAKEIVTVLQISAVDLRRFAPATLKTQVQGFTEQLLGVATNVGLGVITGTPLLSRELRKATDSKDGVAVSDYIRANCL